MSHRTVCHTRWRGRPRLKVFDEAGDSFPTQLCSLGLDDSMSVRSPDARSPGLQSAFEPAWDDTEKDELADKVWNAAGLRRY